MQNSGLGFKRTGAIGSKPVWQRDKAFLLAQGGFALDKSNLVQGQIVREGTPLVFDEANRTAKVMQVAKLYANASNSATTYQVYKGHTLKIGDHFAATPGAAAYDITAIDISNTAYDTVTIGTTLGAALTAGQPLFASTASGSTAAAYPTGINGLLYEDAYIDSVIAISVSAVIRATVYARRVFYQSQLAAVSGLDDIIYSQST